MSSSNDQSSNSKIMTSEQSVSEDEAADIMERADDTSKDLKFGQMNT